MNSRFLGIVTTATLLLAVAVLISQCQTRSMIDVHHCPNEPDSEMNLQVLKLTLSGTERPYEIPVPPGTSSETLEFWISNVMNATEGGGQGPFVTCWVSNGDTFEVVTPRHLGEAAHEATVAALMATHPKTGDCE